MDAPEEPLNFLLSWKESYGLSDLEKQLQKLTATDGLMVQSGYLDYRVVGVYSVFVFFSVFHSRSQIYMIFPGGFKRFQSLG